MANEESKHQQLRVKDAAKLLGHSRSWTWERIRTGELRVVRWGRRDLTVPLQEVERLVERYQNSRV